MHTYSAGSVLSQICNSINNNFLSLKSIDSIITTVGMNDVVPRQLPFFFTKLLSSCSYVIYREIIILLEFSSYILCEINEKLEILSAIHL